MKSSTIRKKTCQSDGCNNPIWGGGYCKYHQNLRPPKANKTPKDRGLFKRADREDGKNNGDFERDKLFYSSIWDSREHKCFNCNCSLGGEPLTLFFDHILEKSRFPDLRYEQDNIMLLCPDCHYNKTNAYYSEKIKQKILETAEKFGKSIKLL